ncbi:GntR family transcriptional regulator [Salinisphaera sp. SPP-AMP-43]|uniref:GntR family transcriptional regulator n=1 Tax=Salinisphaera sp. SPP-AMP-43 TaxID=3121288 RepID=UPI003C6E8BE9
MTLIAAALSSAEETAASTEDRIAAAIRRAVLTQQLPSATKLPESKLAAIFDVNRAVVRAALIRLSSDRIVKLRRNQSAIVVSPSAEETAQLFSARRTVETQVVRETIGHLPNAARHELEQIIAAEQDAHLAQAHNQRINLSLRFHEVIASACPNRVLGDILQDLVVRTSVAVALYKVPGMAACYRCADHHGIAEALIAGDTASVVERTEAHLHYLEQRLNHARSPQTVDLATILGG